MGSPISGLIGKTMLQRLEREVFAVISTKFRKRYVDDTFVIIKKDNLSAFHQLLNTKQDGISFTMETEDTFLGCINSHPGRWQLDATTKMFLSASKVILYNSGRTVIIRLLVWKNRYAPGPYGLEKY